MQIGHRLLLRLIPRYGEAKGRASQVNAKKIF